MKITHYIVFGVVYLSSLVLSGCSGGASDSGTPPPTGGTPTPIPTPPPSPSTVTISATATFERVPFSASGIGLDYTSITENPARGLSAEVLDINNNVLSTHTTDAQGQFSFEIDAETDFRVRIYARLQQSGEASYDIRVLDNTNGEAQYAYDTQITNSGIRNSTINILTKTGWGGSGYTSTRNSATFAILDDLYEIITAIIAVDPDVNMPPLKVFWSPNNKAANGELSNGDIGTSHYSTLNGLPYVAILGDADSDTDEYDSHIIVHEFGHYFENALSRSGSIGGSHSLSEPLDLRMAMSEGFSNALSAIILDDPIYRDSLGLEQSTGFSFDLDRNNFSPTGWFNEGSVQSIIYDVADNTNEGSDTLSGGFAAIYNTVTSDGYKTSPEFISIFTFAQYAISQGGVDPGALNALLSQQSISSSLANAEGETNDGSLSFVLPVYKSVQIDGPSVRVCSTDEFGVYNQLGNREFVRFSVPDTSNLTIFAEAASHTQTPVIIVFQEGQFITGIINPSLERNNYTSGEYILDISADNNINGSGSNGTVCYDVRIETR